MVKKPCLVENSVMGNIEHIIVSTCIKQGSLESRHLHNDFFPHTPTYAPTYITPTKTNNNPAKQNKRNPNNNWKIPVILQDTDGLMLVLRGSADEHIICNVTGCCVGM